MVCRTHLGDKPSGDGTRPHCGGQAHYVKVDLKADLFSYRVMRLRLKSLFAALDLTPPTPSDLAKPVL